MKNNKRVPSEKTNFEIFHDAHLRIQDVLTRMSKEYSENLKGSSVAVKSDGKWRKVGKIVDVDLLPGSIKGKITCILDCKKEDDSLIRVKLPDSFKNPAKNFSDLSKNNQNYIIVRSESELEKFIKNENKN